MTGIRYSFKSTVWKYPGRAAWHFISLPELTSREIRKLFSAREEGWGRLKTLARIGNTEWSTALWYDTGLKTYLMPIKAEIRKREKIEAGGKVRVAVLVE